MHFSSTKKKQHFEKKNLSKAQKQIEFFFRQLLSWHENKYVIWSTKEIFLSWNLLTVAFCSV